MEDFLLLIFFGGLVVESVLSSCFQLEVVELMKEQIGSVLTGQLK